MRIEGLHILNIFIKPYPTGIVNRTVWNRRGYLYHNDGQYFEIIYRILLIFLFVEEHIEIENFSPDQYCCPTKGKPTSLRRSKTPHKARR